MERIGRRIRGIAGNRIFARADSPTVTTLAREASSARAIAALRGPSSLERGLERGDLVEIAAEERHASLVRDPRRESSNAGLATQCRPEGPGESSEGRFDRGPQVRS